jgi:hypothetical protein
MIKDKIIEELRRIRRANIDYLLGWLEDSDFFTAPCIKDHHLNIEGGLAQHSWNVFKLLKEKNERYNLNLDEDTVRICGLLHDLCKVYFYKEVRDNDGNMHYEIADKFSMGHGEKSVIVLQRFIDLTDEECCMIRWHMANFGDVFNEYHKDAYYNAIKMYPAVLALYTADYEATTFLEDMNNGKLQQELE